ncbi:LacI family DNA-binding transcriptional regulator [Sphingobacterium siyangense]|uniref:LacI family DNA-binding transcriptional regulator n=1 Tax=Sphingobacterium siyangense TaxID=459529 RepID=UPI003C714B7C
MKSITIKDIAIALGTSTATVSRALSNSTEVSEETKKRVLEYAKIHNFRYNTVAKMLKTGRSKIVALIVPDLGNLFFSKLLSLLERQITPIGYHLIVMQTHSNPDIELECIESCYFKGIDGLIILSVGNDAVKSRLELMLKEGLAVVDISDLENKYSNADWGLKFENHISSILKNICLEITDL